MKERILLGYWWLLALGLGIWVVLPTLRQNVTALQLISVATENELSPYDCVIWERFSVSQHFNSECNKLSLASGDESVYIGFDGGKIPLRGQLAVFGEGLILFQQSGEQNALRSWRKIPALSAYFADLGNIAPEFDAQIALYRLSIKIHPELPVYLALSKVYTQAKDYATTVQVCNDALTWVSNSKVVDPYFLGLIYQQAGRAFMGMGNYENAKVQFSQALASWPDLPESITGLAQIEIAQGDYEGAIARLTNGLSIVSQKHWIYYWLAVAYNDTDKPEQAVIMLQQALKEREVFAAAWQLLGDIAYQRHDWKLAIQAYQNYLAIMPDDLRVQDLLKTLNGK